MHRWFDSHGQLFDRLGHRLTELIESLPIHPLVEGSTYISAGQPQLDVVWFVPSLFVIESWEGVNTERVVAEEEERYPDHCKDSSGGPKNGLGGRDGQELVPKIQSFDGHIQRRENTIPTFPSPGLGIRRRDLR